MRYHIFRCTNGSIKYEGSHTALWNGPWERNYIREVHSLKNNDILLINKEFWWLSEDEWVPLSPHSTGPMYKQGPWDVVLANTLQNSVPANTA